MKNRPIPIGSDLAKAWGDRPYLAFVGNGEWSSSCPNCGEGGHNPDNGDPDRFRMFLAAENGGSGDRGWCRQCGYFSFADSGRAKYTDPQRDSEEKRYRRELAKKEQARRAAAIEMFKINAVWEFYHDQMNEQHRAMWRTDGIPDSWQDIWQLGFTQSYSGKGFVSAAATIPYFGPGHEFISMQYRLLNPPEPKNKYRFLWGANAELWKPNPDGKMSGKAIVVEGAKKAAVSFINVIDRAGHDELNIVALPSKTPPMRLLDQLQGFDIIYLALDPDAYDKKIGKDGKIYPSEANRITKGINGPEVRAARFPVKPDDWFVKYGGDVSGFMDIISLARVVKDVKA